MVAPLDEVRCRSPSTFKCLQLADSSLTKDVPTNIDILIGSDHYFDVVTDEIRRGQRGPVAINTIFGWVISGPTQNADKDNSSSTNLIIP